MSTVDVSMSTDFSDMGTLDNSFDVSPPPPTKSKTTVIEARCPDCLKEFRKTRALKSFSKCSKVKDFVRIMDNTAKLAGVLLLKQSSTPLTEEEQDRLVKAQNRLNNPAAQVRYNQVLEQRKNSKKQKKQQAKEIPKSLEERAQLDVPIDVPPPRVIAVKVEEPSIQVN